MPEEEVKENKQRSYRIMIGDIVTIRREEFGSKVYYKINLSKKNQDNTTTEVKKPIKFRNGVDLKDNTRIRLIKFFEDFYLKNRYDAIFSLFCTEFETQEENTNKKEEALTQYQDNLGRESTPQAPIEKDMPVLDPFENDDLPF